MVRRVLDMCMLSVSALASAFPCTAARTINLVAETTYLPVGSGSVCIGDNDTCIYFDSTKIVSLDFDIADGAVATISARGYRDTVTILDSAIADTLTIAMRANVAAALSAQGRGDMVVIPDSAAANSPTMAEKEIIIETPSPDTVLVAHRRKRSEDSYRQSSVQFTSQNLATTAGVVEDIGRYIATLPSAVSPPGEGYDNFLVVRGGRPGEVLFLVDGIEMENINHFSKANGSGGPIGFINTDFVDSVQYYAGNIPVSYPSRMSSVVDISMKNGLSDGTRKSIGVKLTGGMLAVQGPIGQGKSAYTVSGRYVDFSPLRAFIEEEGIPKLGDVYGKIAMRPGDGIDLSATGLLSYNTYRYSYPIVAATDGGIPFHNRLAEKERITQGGAGITARYTSGASVQNVRLAFSFRDGTDANSIESLIDTFFLNRYAGNPVRERRDGRMRITLGATSEASLAEHHSVSAGIRAARIEYGFSHSDRSRFKGECIVCDGDTPVKLLVTKVPTKNTAQLVNTEGGLSADYSYKKKILSATVGLRTDFFGLIGDPAVSPRISVVLHPRRAGVFTASAGMYHQFPVEMPSLLFEVLSSRPGLSGDSLERMEREALLQVQPERCWQTSFGYDRSLSRSLEIKVEAYYKWYDREFTFISPGIQNIFTYRSDGSIVPAKQNGERKAYGIETSIGNGPRRERCFYSFAMSLFEAKNSYDGDRWYDDWANVRYTAFLSLGSRFFEHHMAAFTLQGSGGRPFCPQKISLDCIDRKFAEFDSGVAFFSRRLPRLISVNARYAFTRRMRGMDVELSLEVLNALDYTPTVEYRFNGDRFIEIKPFGITPIVGCTVRL